MMSNVVVVALVLSIVCVSAFRPVVTPRTSMRSAVKMSFENEAGALPPVGFWDPLGLSADGDTEVFKRRRAVELKHGRVAMLAVTGYLVQSVARFPGNIDLDGHTFASIPNGIAAGGAVPLLGWLQIFLSIGWWESKGWKQASDDIGDFGFYPKSARPLVGEYRKEQQTKELQNGRLAMIGIMELLAHDHATKGGSLFDLTFGLPYSP